jgi:hypothetical protein
MKINGVCCRYESEPIKESTCSHCGKSFESRTSLDIAHIILNEIKSKITVPDWAKDRANKMAENYEEAIIDAVEDERERIIKSINDINDFDVDAIRTIIIKKIREK